MSAHTPGPWTIEFRDSDYPMWQVMGNIGGEPVVVADQLEQEDARLIAAAPVLLEALEAIVASYDNRVSIAFVIVDKARAAIAQAKGT